MSVTETEDWQTMYLPWPPWGAWHKWINSISVTWPRQVMKTISHREIADIFAYKLCQCKPAIKGSPALVKVVTDNAWDIAMQYHLPYLPWPVEINLSVLRHPRWPSQIWRATLCHNSADVFANKICQCKPAIYDDKIILNIGPSSRLFPLGQKIGWDSHPSVDVVKLFLTLALEQSKLACSFVQVDTGYSNISPTWWVGPRTYLQLLDKTGKNFHRWNALAYFVPSVTKKEYQWHLVWFGRSLSSSGNDGLLDWPFPPGWKG